MPAFPATAPRLGLYPVVDSPDWIERLLEMGVCTLQLRMQWVNAMTRACLSMTTGSWR